MSSTDVRPEPTIPAEEAPSAVEGPPQPRLMEIGWIVAGQLDEPDMKAARQARDAVLHRVSEAWPQFQWKMPLVHRPELVIGMRTEPVQLLQHGLTERDIKHWDFAFLVTGADLETYFRPFALATVSRAFDAAVLSTSRIDPQAFDPHADPQERIDAICRRLTTLALHVLGHLGGLGHADEPENLMYKPQEIGDLDPMREFNDDQIRDLGETWSEVADLRLEEQHSYQRAWAVRFYAEAAWVNRRDILDAFLQARPWQFPLRLSRLTTAAVSALLILIMTAEVWELGMNQSAPATAALSLAAICLTTAYIVQRQGLFIRRENRSLSEQIVTTNVATLAIVLGGMITTYVSLFALGLGIMAFFFTREVAKNWAASIGEGIGAGHYIILAGFISAVGIAIGALGASFEGQNYFRHVTFVDEET